jgi:hypothetical protein
LLELLHVLSRHLAIAVADIDPVKIILGRVVPGMDFRALIADRREIA